MEIKILHLYHDIMNLYGEYGNIKILEKHLKDQEIDVTVDKRSIGEEIHFEDYDFIYIGCGTERNLNTILKDLMNKKDSFIKAIENGVTMLFTGNSFEILGKTIDESEALGVLNFNVTHQNKRITTDAICTSPVFKDKIVGFINTSSIVTNNEKPLFSYDYNTENLETDGVFYKNVIGTHLIGPLLIRNPEILEYFIEKICTNKDKNFKLKEIEYTEEIEGYRLVLNELENRKNMK